MRRCKSARSISLHSFTAVGDAYVLCWLLIIFSIFSEDNDTKSCRRDNQYPSGRPLYVFRTVLKLDSFLFGPGSFTSLTHTRTRISFLDSFLTAFPSNKSVESSSVASFTTRAADSIAVYSQGALPEISAAAHRDVDTATLASHSTAISSITAARRRDAPGATEASTSRASYTPLC